MTHTSRSKLFRTQKKSKLNSVIRTKKIIKIRQKISEKENRQT